MASMTVARRRSRTGAAILGLLLLLWLLPMADSAPAAPVQGRDVIYSTTEDFEQGLAVNLDTDEGRLRLAALGGTFPFIWVALSDRGTIAKVDTRTGDILGEYRSAPTSVGRNPSRTTVGLDGSAWAGNRNSGYVVHVGLSELNQCVDRNGNGVIDTSTGYGDVLDWTTLGPAGDLAATAEDECILHLVDHVGGDARSVSVNPDGDIWVGSIFGGTPRTFELIDGVTGAILRTEGPFDCGGYGGLVDREGVVWSAESGANLLRWDPNAPIVEDENPRCLPVSNYGLAIDSMGWIWVTNVDDTQNVRKVSPDGNTVLGPFLSGATGGSLSQGLAVDGNDHVWVSSGLFCNNNCTVGHLLNDGTLVGSVDSTPDGAGSTGVAVDANGKIWTANINSSTATRIDPTLGGPGADPGGTPIGAVDLTVAFPATADPPLPAARPYNYSDMTGRVLLGATAPQGTWTVTQDSGGTEWGRATWNTQPAGSVPAGSSITVEVRVADTEAALGSQAYQQVQNGVNFSLTGRFIQVRVTLRPNDAGETPVLSDIRVQTLDSLAPPPPPDVTRVAGADRIATAVAASMRGFNDGTAGTVVLARADVHADALAGTPLAVQRGAPLLLSAPGQLDARTEAEIQRVLPQGRTVILLGGTAALSQGVEDRIRALGYQTVRYGGANRFATAVTINRDGLGNPQLLLVASGIDFPDALTAGAAGGHAGGGVVLTAGDRMAAETAAYLATQPQATRVAVGGPAATADPAAERLVGATRFHTSVLVAQRFFSAPTIVGVATGRAFPDSMTGGANIGRLGGPMLLSEQHELPTPVRDYLVANKATIVSAFVYGGSAALAPAVETAVRDAID